MRKGLLIIGFFLLFTLTSCTKINTIFCKHDWEIVDSIYNTNDLTEDVHYKCTKCQKEKSEILEGITKSYKCVITSGEEYLAEKLKDEYIANEKITIKTKKLNGSFAFIYVNDKRISNTYSDDTYDYFEFTMPFEDINVVIEFLTDTDDFNKVYLLNTLLESLDIFELKLEDKSLIDYIFEMYSSLDDTKKAEIKEENINKLNKAKEQIAKLEGYIFFKIDKTTVNEIELYIGGEYNHLINDKTEIESFIIYLNNVAYIRNHEKEQMDCIHDVPSYLMNYIRIDDKIYNFHNPSEGFYNNDGEFDFVISDFTFIYNYVMIKDYYLNLNLDGLDLTRVEKNGKEIVNYNNYSTMKNKLSEINYIIKKIEFFDSYYEFSKDLELAEYKFIFGENLLIYYHGNSHFEIYDLITNRLTYAYCANNYIQNIVNKYLDDRAYINTFNFETYFFTKPNLFEYEKDGETIQLKDSVFTVYETVLFDSSYTTCEPIYSLEIELYASNMLKLIQNQTYSLVDDFDQTNYLEIKMYHSSKISSSNDIVLSLKCGLIYYNEKNGNLVLALGNNIYPNLGGGTSYIYLETRLSKYEQEMINDYLSLTTSMPKYKEIDIIDESESIGVVIKFEKPTTNNDFSGSREEYKAVNQKYIEMYGIDKYFDILLISEVDFVIVFYIDREDFNDFAISYLRDLKQKEGVKEVILEDYPTGVRYIPNPYYFKCYPNTGSILENTTIGLNSMSSYLNKQNKVIKTYEELTNYCNELIDNLENVDNMLGVIKENNLNYIKKLKEIYNEEYFETKVLVITESIFSPVCNEIINIMDVTVSEDLKLYIFIEKITPSIGLTAIKETSFILEIPKELIPENITDNEINLIH